MIPDYVPDRVHTSDQLAIDGPATRLSSVIALRDTQAPLSIGIIGSPGTGKSFFIRRMGQCITDLAMAALSQEQEGLNSRYCSHIVQIYFSGWHYLGSNVVANLASQVFGTLMAAREIEKPGTAQTSERILRHTRGQERDTGRVQDSIDRSTGGPRNTNLEAAVMKDFEDLNNLANIPGELGLDRIVLYFDQLDHCPPDRIMQVLEALRLFFSLPLFVTVVAVDLPWLLWSLERHMPITTPAEREQDPEAVTHWSSTPWNYLEEIIQIPYVLPPMERAGYRRLIDDIVATSMKGTPRVGAADQDHGQDYSEVPSANLIRSQVGFQYEVDAQSRPNSIFGPAPESALRMLEREETDFIKVLAPVIVTPRQAIRMVNLYSLFRASLDRAQLTGLLRAEDGKGEYQAVLLLFAVLISFPTLAVPLFKRVHQSDNDAVSWWKLVQRLRPESGASAPSNAVQSMMTPAEASLWNRMCDQLEEVRTAKGAAGVEELRPFRKWVLEVARFSIRTAHLVPKNTDGEKRTN